MTIPDPLLPKQTPEDLGSLELRERVNHLAVEVLHLTTEVAELRGRVGTLEDVIPSDSQKAQPKERVVPLLARFEAAPSTDDVELGLKSFPQERCHTPPPGSGVEENHDDTPGLTVGPNAQATPRERPARPTPMWPTVKTALILGGAVGLTALPLVGLVRGDDRSDRVSDGTPAATPLVSQVFDVSPPNHAAAGVPAIPQVRNDEPTDGDPSSRLSVLRSAVGSDVIDREPVGQSDAFVVGTPVVFWTHVSGAVRAIRSATSGLTTAERLA